MSVIGIIAEYNPFHNGHKYQIDSVKKSQDDTVVVVMSGNYVQRGDLAIFLKWTRAKSAVLNGADVVIEMPSAFANSCAENFAKCGVYLLDSLGCVDKICFGSETDDLDALKKLAAACESIDASEQMKTALKSGVSYPKARQTALSQIVGKDIASVLQKPNATLGVEYLKALKYFGSDIEPVVIKRKAIEHDSSDAHDGFASASYIRELILSGQIEKVKEFVPQSAFEVYQNAEIHSIQHLENAVLYKLRTMTLKDFQNCPDVSEGLENRLKACAEKATGIDEFLNSVKTKRYTMARIKRILISAFLGYTAEDIATMPNYAKVLAVSEKGVKLLNKCKKSAKIKVSTSIKRLLDGNDCLLNKEIIATDLYNLAMENPKKAGQEFTQKTFVK